MEKLLVRRDELMQRMVTAEAEEGVKAAQAAQEKRARATTNQGLSAEEQALVAWERESKEIEKKIEAAKEVKQALEKSKDKLSKLDVNLAELR